MRLDQCVLNLEHKKAQKHLACVLPLHKSLDKIQTVPVIIGLVVGIGFILLIGLVTHFPVTFSMNDTALGGFPDEIQIIRITQNDLEQKYPVLKKGQDFLANQKQGGIAEPIPFGTNIPILEANEMRNELPFVELSHPDQNFPGILSGHRSGCWRE